MVAGADVAATDSYCWWLLMVAAADVGAIDGYC